MSRLRPILDLEHIVFDSIAQPIRVGTSILSDQCQV